MSSSGGVLIHVVLRVKRLYILIFILIIINRSPSRSEKRIINELRRNRKRCTTINISFTSSPGGPQPEVAARNADSLTVRLPTKAERI